MIALAATMFVGNTTSANAQMVENVNLDDYAKAQYGTSWTKAASKEMENVELDENGNMTLVKEVEAPGLSQNELYVEMANWFICNYDNSIQFADKEQGVLIARPYIEDIARSAGGFNAYNISIRPVVRAQVMDGKVRITYTLHDYNVDMAANGNTAKAIGAGLLAVAVTGAIVDATEHSHHSHTTYVHHSYGRHHHTTTVYREYHPHRALEDAILLSCIAGAVAQEPAHNGKTWQISDCYPFVSKDGHKKASSKAFVMANAYSQVVVNNIEAAIKQCTTSYASRN